MQDILLRMFDAGFQKARGLLKITKSPKKSCLQKRRNLVWVHVVLKKTSKFEPNEEDDRKNTQSIVQILKPKPPLPSPVEC